MSRRWKKTRKSRPTPEMVATFDAAHAAQQGAQALYAAQAKVQAAAAADPASLCICGASGPLELEAQSANGEGKPRLRKFQMTAYTGVAMSLPFFGAPVVVDLEGMRVVSQRQPILRDHDPALIVGHTETIDKSAQRLKVSGVMSGVGEAADEVRELAANDFPWQASIGASIERLEFVEAGEKINVNRRSFTGPIYVARETTLGEISFVPVGADGNTSATVAAKQNREGAIMNFETWLEANGFDAATLNDVQRRTLEAAWKAEAAGQPKPTSSPSPAPNPEPRPVPGPSPNPTPTPAERQSSQTLDQIIAAQRQEEDRQHRVVEMVAEAIQSGTIDTNEAEALGRLAITGKWETQRLELELLRRGRPGVNGLVRASREMPDDGRVIEAAVCQYAGLEKIEKHYDERTLEAASKRWRHGLGLGELILTFARKNGYGSLSLGNLTAAMKAAFHTDIRAGMTGPSTYSLPNVLGNIANKFVTAGFEAVDSTWREIAAIRSVNDFKTITSFSLTGSLIYEKVAPGGELKHGTLGEMTYTNKADTYGRMLGIDRRDIINDDMNAFSGAARRLGRGGALKLNDVFWAEFLDNSAFFAAGNNNVLTGGGSALALAGLEDADEKFRLQTDPDGLPLGIMPRVLLVPSALRITAMNLMNSTLTVSTTTANTPLPAGNPFAGAYRVVSTPYLQNSAYTGYSATAWYLLADPSDLPVIEVVFLNGQQTPTVESAEFDFNTLGICWRGYHDFGTTLQEFRAGVRSAGA